MDGWALLESVEGLDEPPAAARAGALWELLQSEKEDVCREISADGSLIHSDGFAANERDPSYEYTEQIHWRHRDQLEHRLREIVEAQDRLSDGTYGRCEACGKQIEPKRLVAKPTATLCVSCQQSEP
jgi:RNA polymerase-binding protein DksA